MRFRLVLQEPKIGTIKKERKGTEASAPMVPDIVLYVEEKGEVRVL
jgi:hypothetical protein